jgi:hypothetical protein
MHYRNGREVKVGDPVVGTDGSYPKAGVVVRIEAGCGTCNITIARLEDLQMCLTASNFLHLEDALPAGRDPEPVSPASLPVVSKS